MHYKELACKELAQEVLRDVKRQVQAATSAPTLVIVSVGEDPASAVYVRGKIKDCHEVGIEPRHIQLPSYTTQDELDKALDDLHGKATGVILQLPLPDHLDADEAIMHIRPEADVDGLRPGSKFTPCTARGIYEWLKRVTDLDGKNVLIINRSKLVGRPLAKLLLDANATVTVAHSHTPRTERWWLTKLHANVVVTAVGKPGFLKLSDCDDDAIIVDVGLSRDADGKLCGDVDRSECYPSTYQLVTPVPGGVGLLTRAYLLQNVMDAFNGA